MRHDDVMRALVIRNNVDGSPVYADGETQQPWQDYSASEHQLWARMVSRQDLVLKPLAAEAYVQGRRRLDLPTDRIPRFTDLDARLYRCAGWHVIAVNGLLPQASFMRFLAERRFPATWWLRGEAEADYLPEPDLFHDVYGHLPGLTHRAFADFTQLFGHTVLQAMSRPGGEEALQVLARLYWFSIEFGLGGTPDRPSVFGAGIASSRGETRHAGDLADKRIVRQEWDAAKVANCDYAINRLQDLYFTIRDPDAWLRQMRPVLDDLVKPQALPQPALP